jgi:hypothetical protein
MITFMKKSRHFLDIAIMMCANATGSFTKF